MSAYQLTYDTGIASELRKRFAAEVAAVENEGFRPLSVHQEIIYPFSVLVFFPIYLSMRAGNEIVQVQSPLRITTFHLMYASQTHATYAYIYGLGCKFYTNFTDGTWLVSNTHQKIKDKSVIILKSDPEHVSLEKIWERHREKISELEAGGKHLNRHLAFETWVKLEEKFDQDSMLSVIVTGLIWLMLVAGTLYWLVGKLLSLFYTG